MRGNALLIGLGGSGKQSLTRLATILAGYAWQTIEIRKGYNYETFRADIKHLMGTAGGLEKRAQPVVFFFTDSHIVEERFLEDVNNILNTGEVPNLWEPEDIQKIYDAIQPIAQANGVGGSKDVILKYFVEIVRDNLHVVLCLSPASEAFRGLSVLCFLCSLVHHHFSNISIVQFVAASSHL